MEYYRPETLPPDKKESHAVRSIFQGIGCFVVMAFIGTLIAGRFPDWFRTPERIVEAHIEAIGNGDFHRAYHDFTVQYRNNVSFEAFHASFGEFVDQIPCRKINLDHVEENKGKAVVEGVLTGRDGAIFPVHYELIKEQGKWRITSFEWTQPGELTPI